ncbi:MAG: hypothetical protein IIC59_03480 [Proteobacteria bacterium]|nr:hypothetical protein [Pseudomonadota bacterium]
MGINIAINLRLVGFLPRFPLAPLFRFYRLHWLAAAVIFLSGLSLLMAYPAKALTNPVFYLKLSALVSALLISRYFQKMLALTGENFELERLVPRLAYLSLVLWIVTVTAGRFLAYTHSVLLASRFY